MCKNLKSLRRDIRDVTRFTIEFLQVFYKFDLKYVHVKHVLI